MGFGATVLTAETIASRYVLHVVPANGGGVDRYVRDICVHRPNDCILHVSSDQIVFEVVSEGSFFPIDKESYTEGELRQALGRPSILHAHSTLLPVRNAVASLKMILGNECILTLHDIDFARTAAELGSDEHRARLDFVRAAVKRVVPSKFISSVLTTAVGSEMSRQLIENGVDAPNTTNQPISKANLLDSFQVAVVGALGPHKGLNFLHDIVACLPVDIRVVIIGYADGQISQGWLEQGRVWVHGAFEPRELAGIVRTYSCQMALFPNQQPESYCYALSDVWCVGLPALGPDVGAIGERIETSEAGWTYPAQADAEGVASILLQCLCAIGQKAEKVQSAVRDLKSCADMVTALNRIYEDEMTHADSFAQLHGLQQVAATHLNGHFFRQELQKLSGDISFAQTQLKSANLSLQSLKQEYDARGVWIDKLEMSLKASQGEIVRIETARKEEQERAQAAHEQYVAKLQLDIENTLAVAHGQQHKMAIQGIALSMIPSFVRRPMLNLAERLAAAKVSK